MNLKWKLFKNPIRATVVGAFMASANFAFAGEVPSLLADVEAGKLPPVTERLPANPFTVDFAKEGKETGKYGGEMRLIMGKAKDIGQMTVYSYARLVG